MTDALDKMTAPTVDDALLGEDGMPRPKREHQLFRQPATDEYRCGQCAKTWPRQQLVGVHNDALADIIGHCPAAQLTSGQAIHNLAYPGPRDAPLLPPSAAPEDPADRYRRLSKDRPWVSAQTPGVVPEYRKHALDTVLVELNRCGCCYKPLPAQYRTLNGHLLCSDACWEFALVGQDVDSSQLAKLGER